MLRRLECGSSKHRPPSWCLLRQPKGIEEGWPRLKGVLVMRSLELVWNMTNSPNSTGVCREFCQVHVSGRVRKWVFITLPCQSMLFICTFLHGPLCVRASSRSPSSARLPFLESATEKSWHPYSSLVAGGPRLGPQLRGQ